MIQIFASPITEAIEQGARGWCVTLGTLDSCRTRLSPGQRKPNHLTGRIYRSTDTPVPSALLIPTWPRHRGWGVNTQILLRAPLPKRPKSERDRLNKRPDFVYFVLQKFINADDKPGPKARTVRPVLAHSRTHFNYTHTHLHRHTICYFIVTFTHTIRFNYFKFVFLLSLSFLKIIFIYYNIKNPFPFISSPATPLLPNPG